MTKYYDTSSSVAIAVYAPTSFEREDVLTDSLLGTMVLYKPETTFQLNILNHQPLWRTIASKLNCGTCTLTREFVEQNETYQEHLYRKALDILYISDILLLVVPVNNHLRKYCWAIVSLAEYAGVKHRVKAVYYD